VAGENNRRKVAEGVVEEAEEKTNDDFSACIMWMDDYHRLEEWLAYHYRTMKLRYVVIGVDPDSVGSSIDVIDRWNNSPNLKDNFHITVWNETIFVDQITLNKNENEIENEMNRMLNNNGTGTTATATATATAKVIGTAKINQHQTRQRRFYEHCTKHLLEMNKTWASYIENDEFMSIKTKRMKPKIGRIVNDDDDNDNDNDNEFQQVLSKY
jgi:hypothetical protein